MERSPDPNTKYTSLSDAGPVPDNNLALRDRSSPHIRHGVESVFPAAAGGGPGHECGV